MAVIHGTKKNDDLDGTSGNDTFALYKGGSDTVRAGDGDDRFNMGASLDASDRLDGGAGRDVAVLNGDYSAGVTFDDLTITNVELLRLAAGFDYKLTLADGNVAAGGKLSVNAAALDAAHKLTFDGSAEFDGRFAIYAGAGNDALTGGAKADIFHLETGGSDTVHGGGGDDTILMGNTYAGGDLIDGGSGDDTVTMGGVFAADTTMSVLTTIFTSIDTIRFDDTTGIRRVSFSGDITGGGASLTVDASDMGAEAKTFSFSGNTPAKILFTGSEGDDTISFTTNFLAADRIDGGAGSNTLSLIGNYSGFVFSDTSFTNIQTLSLLIHGLSYDLTTADGNVAAGQTLSVIALSGTAGHFLNFDGSAELDGHFSITLGNNADDTLIGGAQSDTFDLSTSFSSHDTIQGGGGDDVIKMGSKWENLDLLDGGAGYDTVEARLNGGFAISSSDFVGIEKIVFAEIVGNFFIGDSAVAAGATLTVDWSAAANGFDINASLDVDGSFVFIGGAGSDLIYGGRISNTFDISHGGSDTANGGISSDTFIAGAAFDAADRLYGDLGSDTVTFEGSYASMAIDISNIFNVETLLFKGAAAVYSGVTINTDIADGSTLVIDASTAASLSLNLSAATSTAYTITGSAGADSFTLSGSGANSVNAGLSADAIVCGGKVDTIVTGLVFDSTGAGNYDTVSGFNFDADKFNLADAHSVAGVSAGAGIVDSAGFDSWIAIATTGHMAIDGACLVFATAGGLDGHTFLVVDVNNDSLYQAGVDYVFDITGYSGTIDTSDFI